MSNIMGTITQANGMVRTAQKWDDGSITYTLPTMVRHGASSASLGYAQRKATAKQAATFVADVVETVVDEMDSVLDDVDAIVDMNVELTVPAVDVVTRPYVCTNAEFMSQNALTASARRFWARKVAAQHALAA